MMSVQEYLEILRDIRDCAFATVDRTGAPTVRIIDVMLVEEGRLYFCTARGKDFYAELMANPAVAVTGLNKKWQTVRLAGRAARLADSEQKAMIDRIFQENPSMEGVYPGEARYILEAFVIAEGRLEFFDLGKSLQSAARAVPSAVQSARKRAFASPRIALAAAPARRSVRSSASRKASRTRLRPRTACTADFVLKAVLWKRSKGWAARRID